MQSAYFADIFYLLIWDTFSCAQLMIETLSYGVRGIFALSFFIVKRSIRAFSFNLIFVKSNLGVLTSSLYFKVTCRLTPGLHDKFSESFVWFSRTSVCSRFSLFTLLLVGSKIRVLLTFSLL